MRLLLVLPLLGFSTFLVFPLASALPAPTSTSSSSEPAFSEALLGNTVVVKTPESGATPTDQPTKRSGGALMFQRRQVHNADFGASPQNRTLSDLTPTAAPASRKKRELGYLKRAPQDLPVSLPGSGTPQGLPIPLPVSGAPQGLPIPPPGPGVLPNNPSSGTPSGSPVNLPGSGTPQAPTSSPEETEGASPEATDQSPESEQPNPGQVPSSGVNPVSSVSSVFQAVPAGLGIVSEAYYGTPLGSADLSQATDKLNGPDQNAPTEPHPTKGPQEGRFRNQPSSTKGTSATDQGAANAQPGEQASNTQPSQYRQPETPRTQENSGEERPNDQQTGPRKRHDLVVDSAALIKDPNNPDPNRDSREGAINIDSNHKATPEVDNDGSQKAKEHQPEFRNMPAGKPQDQGPQSRPGERQNANNPEERVMEQGQGGTGNTQNGRGGEARNGAR